MAFAKPSRGVPRAAILFLVTLVLVVLMTQVPTLLSAGGLARLAWPAEPPAKQQPQQQQQQLQQLTLGPSARVGHQSSENLGQHRPRQGHAAEAAAARAAAAGDVVGTDLEPGAGSSEGLSSSGRSNKDSGSSSSGSSSSSGTPGDESSAEAEQPQQQQQQAAAALSGLGYTERGLALHRLLAEGKQLEWLHLPKTGTTFGNTLIPWACPRLPPQFGMRQAGLPVGGLPAPCLRKLRSEPSSVEDWRVGDHVGLANRTQEELSRVFTLVRSPKGRLASGFHHVHRYGRLDAGYAEMCAFAKRTRVAHAAMSAQVRMIAGDHVATGVEKPNGVWRLFDDNRPPTPAMVDLACARLRSFAFVGITECYDASVCVFHEEFGGRVRLNEWKNMRPGLHQRVGYSVKQVDCNDAPDEQLFACAKALFLEQLARHPVCLQLAQETECELATQQQQQQGQQQQGQQEGSTLAAGSDQEAAEPGAST